MEYFMKAMQEYATFTGRATRREYWMFVLFQIIFSLMLYALTIVGAVSESQTLMIIGSVLLGIYILATFIPSLAAAVRRLHDTGRSGWFYFIAFVPVVGGIILIVFLASEGQHGPNKWGPNPLDDQGMDIKDHLIDDNKEYV